MIPSIVLQNGTDTALGEFFAQFVPEAYAELVASVVLFVVGLLAVYLLGRIVLVPLVNRVLRSRELDEHARKPLIKLTKYLVILAAVAVAFGAAGLTGFLQSIATIAAAGTLAIGFAMQDVIANFVAGVFIFVERPFRIGDWIEWDDNSGIVEDISLRVTRVRSFDNELLTVPNSNLTDDVVKNPVAKDKLRLKFLFGIGYDDDIQQATDIIVEEAENHDEILDDPAPSVRLTELAGSSVGLQSRIWIEDPSRADFVRIRGEYVTAVKRRFDEAGIDIPYPIRTLDGGIAVTEGELVAEMGDD
jgi:small-conductance mechanosensitive channel